MRWSIPRWLAIVLAPLCYVLFHIIRLFHRIRGEDVDEVLLLREKGDEGSLW